METAFSYSIVGLYIFVLVYAAVSDFRKLIIPNWISVTLAALFFAHTAVSPANKDVWQHLGVAAIAFFVGLLLYAMRWFAAGDVKLFSALALWAGTPHIIDLVLYTTLFGGLFGIALLMFNRSRRDGMLIGSLRGLENLAPRWVKLGIVPYGLAISAGGLMLLPHLFAL